MKKTFKKFLVTAALVASMVAPQTAIDTKAATAPTVVEATTYKGGNYYTGTEYGAPIEVTLENGEEVTNIKSSSEDLKVFLVTREKRSTTNKALIGIWTTKAGTYKVTFSVVDAAGKVKENKEVTVIVKYTSSVNVPISRITYAGKNVFASKKTNKGRGMYDAVSMPKKGRFKVTMKKGYKVKSIEVGKYQKYNTPDGYSTKLEYSGKKLKNGGKVKLGKTASSFSTKSDTSESLRKNMEAGTTFRITYINKKTKEEGVYTITLNRLVNYVK